jgi:hypothetical protein
MMLANAGKWLASQAGAEERYAQARADPEIAQNEKLQRYLQRNADCDFGRKHRFSWLRSYEEFAAAVPLGDYRDFEPWIERIAAGEKKVLTAEPVIGVEETSGSSGATKWIPFTDSLRREFEGAVGVWLRDMARHCPEAVGGRAYWSISPPLKLRGKTNGGLPIGVGSDLGYFSDESAKLLMPLMAVSPDICNDYCADSFWQKTVDALLGCPDLALISVWSPSFFLTLDREVRERTGDDDFVWSHRWPNLAMLSCWTDAQSAMWLPMVRERLGQVPIQGKGLLSTEGVVSIPLSTQASDPMLALDAHFFEFRERHTDTIALAHELQSGQEYEVILTTGGGLYRYVTGDLVLVGDNFSLRFAGRAGSSSDMVGEKLDDAQVTAALAGVAGGLFVAAMCDDSAAGYRVFVSEFADADAVAAGVEAQLNENAYYQQAIELGQLRPLEAQTISAWGLSELVEQLARRQNARLGDVKLPSLFRTGELEGLLGGKDG